MKKNTQRVTRSRTIPAPVRGLNYKDSLAAMKDTDALILENFVCRPSYIEVRKGWQPDATGFGADVETLMPYLAADGINKLFAAAGTGIYDVTSPGTIGAALVSGMTSAYWAQTQISNLAGNFLTIVNGVDPGQQYNGTTWAAWSITGVVSDDLTQLEVWKRRIWAVEKDSFTAWYGALDAISGAMTAFPLSGIFRRGGRLQAVITWTVDGGNGADDFILFVTNQGEVAVYQGVDPDVANSMALRGVYYIGAPIGERFYAKLGGDVILLTSGGLIAFSKFLQTATVDRSSQLTENIQALISADIASYQSIQGWEVHVYFEDNLVFLQVPGGPVGNRYQYTMSTLTGAWSKITQAPVITYAVFNGRLMAGHSTQTANSWTGGLDDTTPITYTMVPAFSYFGDAGSGKRFTLGRATIESDASPTYTTKLLRDFDTSFLFPSQTPAPLSGALWDVAIWDQDIWGGSSSFYRRLNSFVGIAFAASQALQGVSSGTVLRIVALEYMFEPGGPGPG